MKLSPHFDLLEFTDSMKAHELEIKNIPNLLQISRMQALCDIILEPVREHFNNPVIITSGFRSPELNEAVGGKPDSQHLFGEAADIRVANTRNDDVWRFIVHHLNFDQCIAEKIRFDDGQAGWIHVSHKIAGKQRQESLSFLGEKYVSGLSYIS